MRRRALPMSDSTSRESRPRQRSSAWTILATLLGGGFLALISGRRADIADAPLRDPRGGGGQGDANAPTVAPPAQKGRLERMALLISSCRSIAVDAVLIAAVVLLVYTVDRELRR